MPRAAEFPCAVCGFQGSKRVLLVAGCLLSSTRVAYKLPRKLSDEASGLPALTHYQLSPWNRFSRCWPSDSGPTFDSPATVSGSMRGGGD
jgi:hypothetical protein